MIGGNEDKVTERTGEAIIRDFHKRLDRSRISVAIIAVRIYDVAASNEDGSFSANQTGRAVLFSFPAPMVGGETRDGLDGRLLIRF